MSNIYILTSHGELYHYGVKGQKWGVRRYQNDDGTLTEAGRLRRETQDKARRLKDEIDRTLSDLHGMEDNSEAFKARKRQAEVELGDLGSELMYKAEDAYLADLSHDPHTYDELRRLAEGAQDRIGTWLLDYGNYSSEADYELGYAKEYCDRLINRIDNDFRSRDD